MGSNMQRQAVPLVRAEAPFVGTGMEGVVARDSRRRDRRAPHRRDRPGRRHPYRGARHRRARPDQVGRRHLPADEVPALEPEHLHQPASAGEGGRSGASKGDIIADGPSTELGELALGRNVLVAFMPWNGYNFEDSILLSERIVKDDVFTSIHIEEFEVMARDTKLGPGGNHPRHPERLGRGAEEPRRGRHRLYRRGSARRRHPVRQDHAEGRKPDDAGREAAARHLRREGLRRARHLAARAAGRAGHGRRGARVQPPRRREGRARARDRARGDRAARQGPRRRAGDPRSQRLRPSRPRCWKTARASPARRASRRTPRSPARCWKSIRVRSGGSSPRRTTS